MTSGYPESWSTSEGADAATWWDTARPYLRFALLVIVTVATVYGLVVWLPNIASASAPGGCGGG